MVGRHVKVKDSSGDIIDGLRNVSLTDNAMENKSRRMSVQHALNSCQLSDCHL
jgi:hypothetical protein